MSAGELIGDPLDANRDAQLQIGSAGYGTFTQTGGLVDVPTLAMGLIASAHGNGVYRLQGGTLRVETIYSHGNNPTQFSATGGRLEFGSYDANLYVSNITLAPMG